MNKEILDTVKGEKLEKLEIILNGSKENITVKGQVLSIMKCERKDTRDVYYTFVMKVLKSLSDDEYGQSFNTMNIVMPADYVKVNKITDESISAMKKNEVICILASDCHAKRITQSDGVTYYVNNINFYVVEMHQTKELEKVTFGTVSKPVAL